jgi:hypothetical protein
MAYWPDFGVTPGGEEITKPCPFPGAGFFSGTLVTTVQFHKRASAKFAVGLSFVFHTGRYAKLRSLAHQGLFNPSARPLRRLERGNSANSAFAEPRLKVPKPLVLRGMGLAIKADDDGGELAVCEDEPAFAVMAVDEHAHGHK